ncbi:putative DNA-binding transcriptional regulator YafY [Salinibacter ruber]|uniref:helix-turn-helix transcriptional regulator n=1 Tax=Salinibacter ruber TaxID=146919 RepID=UPI0021697DC0|nr:WYL domain-containing protein [Salinibacter ruber]MCS3635469.1 putative DNA-binding transcriptional regulator YafY [Salinibacter ruber]MCS3714959.1 putative DNA-binding transcriptional regulator YafY [Salinibacter ruber]
MTPSERWPAILLQLEPSAWTRATDLARALCVSERTVYRDVQAMVEAGVPLQGVPGKGYRLPDDYLLAPIRLTRDEAVMLVLGSAYAARNFSGRYQAAARAARHKIEDVLPPDDRERVLSLRGSVSLVPSNVFGDSTEDGLLRQARHALVEERTLLATLAGASDDGPSTRRIDPYGLVRQGSAWHLVGYGHDREHVVHLRLERIRGLDMTDATFERPASYGARSQGPAAPSQRRVRVVFADEAAAAVQVPSSVAVESREHLSDDRLLLTLNVDHVLEVMPWLLSWGRHAQVLEPRALRERMATEARAVADQYESAPTLLD